MWLRSSAVRILSLFRLYEPSYVRFLASRLKPGATLIDVGANFGAYSLSLASTVGEQGTIIAIEPLPWVYDLLTENARRFPQIDCRNIAVSDQGNVTACMRVPLLFGRIPEPSLASLRPEKNGRQIEVSVLCETLDHLLTGFTRIDAIKLDVEGHELACLWGAANVIRLCRPLVMFECNRPEDLASFHSFAKEFGYSVCMLQAGQLTRLKDDEVRPDVYNYFLATTESG